jgi:serine/threonine protein kinase
MSDADWSKYKRLRGRDLPTVTTMCGGEYALAKLFKHDFYAATGVYRRQSGAGPEAVVLKVYHTDRWGIVPLGWLGRSLHRRETAFYRALAGVPNVPRMLEDRGDGGFVREYIPGGNVREVVERDGRRVNADFYPTLQKTLADIHARGVAHNDLSKPENVLVGEDGKPWLIDFQIASMPKRWPLGLGRLAGPFLRYFQSLDDYHLCKQYRRYRPEDVSEDVRRRGTRRGGLVTLHYYLIRAPYRFVRHLVRDRFLRRPTETPAPPEAAKRAA